MSRQAVLEPLHATRDAAPAVGVTYRICFVTSIGSTMLMNGIFFYTAHYFGWGSVQNFLLAVVQGTAYIVASLAAQPISARLGRRRTLVVVNGLAALVALAGAMVSRPAVVTAILVLYVLVSGTTWPVMENLVSTGANARELSRRIGVYNLIWSGANALTIAVCGTIIQYLPHGVFVIPAVCHVVVAITLVLLVRGLQPGCDLNEDAPRGLKPARQQKSELLAHEAPDAEPELLRSRTLALWLSRISLPATFMVIYSMMAMMPTLHVMRGFDTAERTVLTSVWLTARWMTFLLASVSVWWHTRPRMLLWAAVVMLIAFLAIVMPAEIVEKMHFPLPLEVAWVAGWEVALGIAVGAIYMGSLYFGMVLSEGATEHGGYHEALIGVGSILGPGAGALAQWLHPESQRWGVAAVGCVVLVTILMAGVANGVLSRANRER